MLCKMTSKGLYTVQNTNQPLWINTVQFISDYAQLHWLVPLGNMWNMCAPRPSPCRVLGFNTSTCKALNDPLARTDWPLSFSLFIRDDWPDLTNFDPSPFEGGTGSKFRGWLSSPTWLSEEHFLSLFVSLSVCPSVLVSIPYPIISHLLRLQLIIDDLLTIFKLDIKVLVHRN